jgi:hypothetical protein
VLTAATDDCDCSVSASGPRPWLPRRPPNQARRWNRCRDRPFPQRARAGHRPSRPTPSCHRRARSVNPCARRLYPCSIRHRRRLPTSRYSRFRHHRSPNACRRHRCRARAPNPISPRWQSGSKPRSGAPSSRSSPGRRRRFLGILPAILCVKPDTNSFAAPQPAKIAAASSSRLRICGGLRFENGVTRSGESHLEFFSRPRTDFAILNEMDSTGSRMIRGAGGGFGSLYRMLGWFGRPAHWQCRTARLS